MAEGNESNRLEKGPDAERKFSISIDPRFAAPRLVGRMLGSLGALLSDVGEFIESVAPLDGPKPPDPKPCDEFEKKDKTKYVVCDSGKCREVHRDDKTWCLPGQEACADPCFCMLLRAKKSDKEPKYEPDEDTPDGQHKYPYDPDNYWYFCACVKPKPKSTP